MNKYPGFTQNFSPRQLLEKDEKKNLLIFNSALDQRLMIPLIFLCDEYIDRSKMSEQKKTHLSI